MCIYIIHTDIQYIYSFILFCVIHSCMPSSLHPSIRTAHIRTHTHTPAHTHTHPRTHTHTDRYIYIYVYTHHICRRLRRVTNNLTCNVMCVCAHTHARNCCVLDSSAPEHKTSSPVVSLCVCPHAAGASCRYMRGCIGCYLQHPRSSACA